MVEAQENKTDQVLKMIENEASAERWRNSMPISHFVSLVKMAFAHEICLEKERVDIKEKIGVSKNNALDILENRVIFTEKDGIPGGPRFNEIKEMWSSIRKDPEAMKRVKAALTPEQIVDGNIRILEMQETIAFLEKMVGRHGR